MDLLIKRCIIAILATSGSLLYSAEPPAVEWFAKTQAGGMEIPRIREMIEGDTYVYFNSGGFATYELEIYSQRGSDRILISKTIYGNYRKTRVTISIDPTSIKNAGEFGKNVRGFIGLVDTLDFSGIPPYVKNDAGDDQPRLVVTRMKGGKRDFFSRTYPQRAELDEPILKLLDALDPLREQAVKRLEGR